MAGTDDKKKKKPQTPGGGKPRKNSASAKDSTTPYTTGGQTHIYANDPESSGMTGYTDYSPKRYSGGSAQTFVNGHGIDTGRLENSNFVSMVNRYERDRFRRLVDAEKAELERDSLKARRQREREERARARQEGLDRDFKRGVFKDREGWDSLGRSKGTDENGKVVEYGRGATGVANYEARYEKIRKRADILTKYFADGDYTGRGKEWAAIRDLVTDTHENKGGLTEKQIVGINNKMESMLRGLNDQINAANKANEYLEAQDMARKRKAVGDDAGLLSDDQVNRVFDKHKWDNVRGAIEKYGQASGPVIPSYDGDVPGGYKRTGDRIDALQTLLNNGISTNQIARIAVRSGEGDWGSRYGKLLSGNLSKEARTQGIEDLAVEYIKQKLANGDVGVKELNDAIASDNTRTGKTKAVRNKELSWGDEDPLPPSGGTDKPGSTSTSDNKPPTPQEARMAAENAEMFRQGATAEEVAQPGPTPRRANEDVQKAGDIAAAATQAGSLPPVLTPREKFDMKMTPGSHQSNGSMGEVTPTRAIGLADLPANLDEALVEVGIPLKPRKQDTPVPLPRYEPQPVPLPTLHGGRTGEHAVQTLETGFDRAADKIARKVKSWFD